jgi:hypothetical protein
MVGWGAPGCHGRELRAAALGGTGGGVDGRVLKICGGDGASVRRKRGER